MTDALTMNIILAAAIFVAALGPLVWAIRIQIRSEPKNRLIEGRAALGSDQPSR